MPNLPPLSKSSASCRLEWRPSQQERACLALLTLLAAVSLLQCDLPLLLAWPAAIAAIGSGILCLKRSRERPARECLFAHEVSACRIDGQPVLQLAFNWRGPLLFVHFKPAGKRRWQHLVFWPDTLPAAKRRELRLAAPVIPVTLTSTRR